MQWLLDLTPDEWNAVRLSIRVATVAMVFSLPPGILIALLLARGKFWGKSVLNGLVHLPLILPPVVTGYLLLLTFGKRGPIGAFLDQHFGIVFSFRWTGAALACGVMAFPLMVRAIRLSIEAVDRRLEAAAGTLGANPAWVFGTITLPLILPGIIAGMILCFAKAMGEFGATITFVSNIPGETQTLPSAIYTFTQVPGGDAGALRLTLISIVIAMVALVASEVLARRVGRTDGRRMSLQVDIRHRLGAFSLDATFETSGRLTALFGPSGSGKTSLVNLIGGLLRPDEGRIVADGRVLVDTAARIFVPKHKRRIGYVFQDARLFPHMTVGQNLRYGRFFTPAAERYSDMDGVVELLGIGHLLDRRPGLLSGGEKQRVAIGRALLASPRLILMDEPLASLDDRRKAEIMPYIERLRDETKIPIVYVSHSVAEVARLATDIVVLDEGKVGGIGPDLRNPAAPRPFAGGGTRRRRRRARDAGRRPQRGIRHVDADIAGRRDPGCGARRRNRLDRPRTHSRARRHRRDREAARHQRFEHTAGQDRRDQFRRRPFRRRADRLQRRGRHRAHHPAIRRNARSRARPRRVCRDQISHLRPRQHDARHCRPGIAFGRDDRGGECRVE